MTYFQRLLCQEHLDGERVPPGEAGKSHGAQRCPCRLDPLPGELAYHQLLHCPSNQTVVKSKHSSLHMFGLALIYIRVNQASRHADFLHTQTLAQMCLGTSNMNLSEYQIGRGNAGEGRII